MATTWSGFTSVAFVTDVSFRVIVGRRVANTLRAPEPLVRLVSSHATATTRASGATTSSDTELNVPPNEPVRQLMNLRYPSDA